MGRVPRAGSSSERSRHQRGSARPDGIFKTLRTGLKRFWPGSRNAKPTSPSQSSSGNKTPALSVNSGFGSVAPARRSPRNVMAQRFLPYSPARSPRTIFNPNSPSQRSLRTGSLSSSSSSSYDFLGSAMWKPPAPRSARSPRFQPFLPYSPARSPRTTFRPKSLNLSHIKAKTLVSPSSGSHFWGPSATQSSRIATPSWPASSARPVTMDTERKLITCSRKHLHGAGPTDYMKAICRELDHNAALDKATANEMKESGTVPIFEMVRYRIVYI